MIRRLLSLYVALAALAPTLAGSHCLRVGAADDEATPAAHADHLAHGPHAAVPSTDRDPVPQPIHHEGTPGDCPLAMTCVAPAVPSASVRMIPSLAAAHPESGGAETPERFSRASLEPPPPRHIA